MSNSPIVFFALLILSACCSAPDRQLLKDIYPATAERFDNGRPVLRVSRLTEDERQRLPGPFLDAYNRQQLFVMFDAEGEVSVCRKEDWVFSEFGLHPKVTFAQSDRIEEVNAMASRAGLEIHRDRAWPQFVYYALPEMGSQNDSETRGLLTLEEIGFE